MPFLIGINRLVTLIIVHKLLRRRVLFYVFARVNRQWMNLIYPKPLQYSFGGLNEAY